MGRRKRHDSSLENEPTRRIQRHDSSSDDNYSSTKKRHDSSSDDNNQRTKIMNSDSDASPPRKKVKSKNQSDSDFSPPRQGRNNNTSNLEGDSDNSPPRDRPNRKQSDSDNSPNRVKTHSSLAKTTLDGKKAGLQNASSLKSEMDVLRGEEKRRLNALSSEISGRGAKTMIRGRLKEKRAEEERKKAESEISETVKEQYSRWSKGLKQMDNDKRKIELDLHEMGKSFARSANDEDMNEKLKAADRAE